jgi:WD40 repeat protein
MLAITSYHEKMSAGGVHTAMPQGSEGMKHYQVLYLKTLKGHKWSVRCLSTTPDGKILVSGSNDDTICLWGLPDGRYIKALEEHTKWVNCLSITPDGKILASRSYGSDAIHLWGLFSRGKPP